MIELKFLNDNYIIFLKKCYIKLFSLTMDGEYGSNLYIVYHSFISDQDLVFINFFDEDIEELNFKFCKGDYV